MSARTVYTFEVQTRYNQCTRTHTIRASTAQQARDRALSLETAMVGSFIDVTVRRIVDGKPSIGVYLWDSRPLHAVPLDKDSASIKAVRVSYGENKAKYPAIQSGGTHAAKLPTPVTPIKETPAKTTKPRVGLSTLTAFIKNVDEWPAHEPLLPCTYKTVTDPVTGEDKKVLFATF